MMDKFVISIIKMLAPVAFKSYLNSYPGGDQIRSLANFRHTVIKVLKFVGNPEEMCNKMKVALDFYADGRAALISWARGRYRNPEQYFAEFDRINNKIDGLYNKLRLAVDTGVINDENWQSFRAETLTAIENALADKADHRSLEAE